MRKGLFEVAIVGAAGLIGSLFIAKAINKESPVEIETTTTTEPTELEKFCLENFGVELQTLKPSMRVMVALYKKRKKTPFQKKYMKKLLNTLKVFNNFF